MAASAEYLARLRRAVRRNSSTDVDAEVTELIEECRGDMVRLGILPEKVNDESDPLILGAMKCFMRSHFGLSNPDAEKDKENYAQRVDEIRKTTGYMAEV